MPRSFALFLVPFALAAVSLPLMARGNYDNPPWHDELSTNGKPVGTAWAPVDSFESLIAVSEDEVHFSIGPRWQIRASGDPRAIAQLRYLHRKHGLAIGRIEHQKEHFGKLRIEVTAPSLRAATTTGSGSLEIDRLTGSQATITIAGSGATTVRSVNAAKLDATIAGSGNLSLVGASDSSRIVIAGSGGLSAPHFTARQASVTVAGSGTARFAATGAVSASLVGSGNVFVTGTRDCRQTRMGSGRLVCMG